MHGHEVPGHGPVRILSLLDGDAAGVPPEVEARLRGEDQAPAPRPGAPTVVLALAGCLGAQLLVTCLLVGLRVGGAVDWSCGWVLAPLGLPTLVVTTGVLATCVALATLNERDAARRGHA